MTNVMVFNFKSKKYELASREDGKALIDLIDTMNLDCANAEHTRYCECEGGPQIGWAGLCKICLKEPRA